MAWKGGFSGVGFDRAEFKKWLSTQKKPPYHRIVNHMTDAPYTKASVGCVQRIKNLGNYYKNDLGWSGGPDFFVLGDGKVYLGTPMGHSIGCKGWNGNSFHIEVEGKYNGKTHDYAGGQGLANWRTSAWIQAELLAWMGWPLNGDRIKLHKEGSTSHNCPGVVPKQWIMDRIKEAQMSSTDKLGVKPIPSPAPVPPKAPEVTDRMVVSGVPTGDWLNTRAGPGTSYTANGKLYNGTMVSVLGKSGIWAQVRTPAGFVVWVSSAYLKPVSAATDAPKPEEPAPVEPPKRGGLFGLHMSDKGLALLKHFEGLRLAPYDDNGSLAIGYGHSNRSEKPPYVTPDLRITTEEALQILASDLVDYENRVKKMVKVPLYQHEFDALVSLAYNWGPGNLERSQTMAVLNSGDYAKTGRMIREILPSEDKYYYKGIVRRRNAEADLFEGK